MVQRLIQHIKRQFSKLRGSDATPKHPPADKPAVHAPKPPAHAAERPKPHTPAETPHPRPHGRHHPAPKEGGDHPRPAPQPAAAPIPWSPDQYVVPPAPGKTRFHDLNLPDPILHAIADLGFQYCMPVQALAIPPALDGKDVTGKAQTGTGKTAAFLIAIFTHFLRHPRSSPAKPGAPRALILAPTRELALQIEKDARALGAHTGFKILAVYGGMDYDKQQRQLVSTSPDIIVATPGRLLDYRRGGHLHLRHVEVLVIDEADRMLDMGFIPDVRTIVYSTPPKENRQTLLFSATLTPDILRLASRWMKDPVQVEVEPEKVTVDTIRQVVYTVSSSTKFALFLNLLKRDNPERLLMFCNRRDETERVLRLMDRYRISADMLSGAVPQKKRLQVLEAFREGKIRVLVATDVAGRGLHVDGISHVINYDIPFDAEDYVHRIGRTGRAGASGVAYTFACENEAFSMPEIEKYIGRPLEYENPEPALLELPPAPPRPPGEPVRHFPRADEGRPRSFHGGGARRGGSRPPRRPGSHR